MKEKSALAENVHARLRKEIENGRWKEGDKIPSEKHLCDMFSVSRTTIRAALQRLEAQGYIRTEQGSGTYVESVKTVPVITNKKKKCDLYTILEYRLIIEKGIIGLTAKRITKEGINQLQANYNAMKAAVGNNEEFSKLDYRFHSLLAEFSGNEILIKTSQTIEQILEKALDMIVAILGCGLGLKYHKEIIEALEEGNAEKCEKIMEEHIQETIDGIRMLKGEDVIDI